MLKVLLLLDGGPQISVLSTPWYPADEVDESTLSRYRRWWWNRLGKSGRRPLAESLEFLVRRSPASVAQHPA